MEGILTEQIMAFILIEQILEGILLEQILESLTAKDIHTEHIRFLAHCQLLD